MSPSAPNPVLHLIHGKIAAGKSTLAKRLAEPAASVLISEDDWLGGLFADQMTTPRDYMRCAARLQAVMGPHVTDLLQAGLSVVLDFPANTPAQRDWMRSLLTASGADHQMHVLEVADAVCLARLKARNASGEHPFSVTEQQFHQVNAHISPPTEAEGFTLVRHGADG